MMLYSSPLSADSKIYCVEQGEQSKAGGQVRPMPAVGADWTDSSNRYRLNRAIGVCKARSSERQIGT